MIDVNALFDQHFNHDQSKSPDFNPDHDVPLHDEMEIGDMFETKVAGMVLDLERILHFIGAGSEVKGDVKHKLLAMSAQVTTIADGIEAQEDHANPLETQHYDLANDD